MPAAAPDAPSRPPNRRQFLQRAALLAAGAPALGAFLDACSKCADAAVVGAPTPDDRRAEQPGDVADRRRTTSRSPTASPPRRARRCSSTTTPTTSTRRRSSRSRRSTRSTRSRSRCRRSTTPTRRSPRSAPATSTYDIYFPSYDQISRLVDGRADPPAQPQLHPQHRQRVADASPTRGTTRAGATPCPTPSTPPGSAGAPTRCPTTSPRCRNPYDVALGSDVQGQDRDHRRLAHRDGAWCCCAPGKTDINTAVADDLKLIGDQLTADGSSATVAEGHHHHVQRPAGRPVRASARCGPATSSTRSPTCPKGTAPDDPALLVPRRRQGHGRQRPDGRAQGRQEPGARAPVPQPHARHQGRARRTSPTSATSRRRTRSIPETLVADGSSSRRTCASAIVKRGVLRRRLPTARAAAANDAAWHKVWQSVQGRRSDPVTLGGPADLGGRTGRRRPPHPAVAAAGRARHRLAGAVLPRAALRGARHRVRSGRPDLPHPGAGVEPAAVGRRLSSTTSSTHIVGADGDLRPGAAAHRSSTCCSASVLCLLIAFPVAYYVARLAGRRKGLILALLIAPFWISYMMRMLAWVNLLQNDGLVNKALEPRRAVRRATWTG